jgi:hypothetical protein
VVTNLRDDPRRSGEIAAGNEALREDVKVVERELVSLKARLEEIEGRHS